MMWRKSCTSGEVDGGEEIERPKRKHPRLKGYDCSRNGACFLTLCAKGRASIKRYTNRLCACSLWQTGYHDHIIRDNNDLLSHWTYIDQNHAQWAEDKYFAG